MTYILLDGDSIGDSFELLYLDDRLEEAVALSSAITSAVQHMKASLSASGAIVHVAAGDDVLATFPDDAFNLKFLSALTEAFRSATGHTLSGGVGCTLSHAATNLRRAKLCGKNKIIFTESVR